MKTDRFLIVGGIFILFTSASNLPAQDWVKTNPEMNRILVDTSLVRAMVVTIQPGQKSKTHTHPAQFIYPLTDGKLVVHYADGKDQTYHLEAGDAGFSGPERPHVIENAGDKVLRYLLLEMKEHPYKAPKNKNQ